MRGLWEWMMDSRSYISFSLGSWSPDEHLLPHIPTPPALSCAVLYQVQKQWYYQPSTGRTVSPRRPLLWSLVCVTVTEGDWYIPLRRFSESSHLAIRWWWLSYHMESRWSSSLLIQAVKPGALRLSGLVQSLMLKPNNIQATLALGLRFFLTCHPRVDCECWEALAPALVHSWFLEDKLLCGLPALVIVFPCLQPCDSVCRCELFWGHDGLLRNAVNAVTLAPSAWFPSTVLPLGAQAMCSQASEAVRAMGRVYPVPILLCWGG